MRIKVTKARDGERDIILDPGKGVVARARSAKGVKKDALPGAVDALIADHEAEKTARAGS